jgi:hypothetical protein
MSYDKQIVDENNLEKEFNVDESINSSNNDGKQLKTKMKIQNEKEKKNNETIKTQNIYKIEQRSSAFSIELNDDWKIFADNSTTKTTENILDTNEY